MLPINYNSLTLSDDAQLRMNAFYTKYCLGNNGSGHHLGHLILACEMAFPMVLSPRLCNLLWLNFGHFPYKYGTNRIDNVAITDILFSSLCRPLIGKQFEIIPEIRTYLLFLLHDGKWLSNNGISPFGRNRLEMISRFILAYLSDKKMIQENNSAGFKDLNRYAALAYLSPDLLSADLAKNLQTTFGSLDGEDRESEQLRLNLVIKRFDEQNNLKLNQKNKTYKSIAPLVKFSNANKERLFDKPSEVVSDLFYSIDKQFIGEMKTDSNTIQLPIKGPDNQRLLRKKDDVQRIFTIFVSVDSVTPKTEKYINPKIRLWEDFMRFLKRRKDFELTDNTLLINQEASFNAFTSALEQIVHQSLPEDIVLIYYNGTEIVERGDSLIFSGQSGVELVDEKRFSTTISNFSAQKNTSTILILDFPIRDITAYKDAAKFVLGSGNISKSSLRVQNHSEGILNYLVRILYELGTLPSYSDLLQLMNKLNNDRNIKDNLEFQLWTKANKETLLLGRKTRRRDFSKHFIVFNKAREIWEVVQEDFVDILLNRNIQVFEYSGKQMEVSGEIFSSDDLLEVGGDLYSLDREKIYLVRSRPISLDYIIIHNNGYSNREKINSLFRRFPDNRFNRYGMFNSIIENGYKSKAPSVLTDRIILEPGENGTDNILFKFESKEESLPAEEIAFESSELKEIKEAIRQFSQYSYLRHLDSVRYETRKVLFNLPMSLGWPGRRQIIDGGSSGKTLIFDQNCYETRNGQLRIYELELNFNNNLSEPVYFDIYVLLPNFQISRIISKKLDSRVMPNDNSFKIDLNEWADLLIDYNQVIKLKFLFSTAPITIDFSQKGVDKNLLKTDQLIHRTSMDSKIKPFNFEIQLEKDFNWGINPSNIAKLNKLLAADLQNKKSGTKRLTVAEYRKLAFLLYEKEFEHLNINEAISLFLEGKNAAVPKPFNEKRVLVTGNGDEKLNPIEERVARAVGRELALEGYGVIGGGWPGVDEVVTKAFLAEFKDNGLNDDDRHITLVEHAQKLAYPVDKIDTLPPNHNWYQEATERVIAVILIGGKGGTYKTYEAARQKGLPVFPIRDTGGDAERIYYSMHKEGELLGGEPLGKLIPDDQAASELCKNLIKLLIDISIPRPRRK